MDVHTTRIELSTRGHADVVDVTERVAEAVAESGLDEGTVTLFCPGSTGGLTTIEYEPGVVSDLQRLFDEIAAPDRPYRHHLAWGDDNGHSHVRAGLLGPSLVVPFEKRRPTLGTWQQIVFVDFDTRARQRRIVTQLAGLSRGR